MNQIGTRLRKEARLLLLNVPPSVQPVNGRPRAAGQSLMVGVPEARGRQCDWLKLDSIFNFEYGYFLYCIDQKLNLNWIILVVARAEPGGKLCDWPD